MPRSETQDLRKLLREVIDAWHDFNGLMHTEAAKTAEQRTPESQLELRAASSRFSVSMFVADEYLRSGVKPRKKQ